ncbi:Pre-mRNA-splicing factor cef1 [Malassezia vespertilionis]|uniref:Pre-mRNA-splicing factor CEF1 n=1 Tax=Malassezia vespertilionis TaxID=2020962 RepID=A0A2N1JH94_9BASI|nr:Pre-mRNA-splicing factor cef1 [Malassezia vespertilionis]PKI85914.1 Cef1p [Malassezia vespertilionis]WFD04863.1 Pre-mRNA-splicing factor cef1 [Malassezia vespertilionis]
MVRVIVKGGVWKNTEDEILKAAVSKYGKNQWARISSLLVRKTPKQCKARWYEWLDPSIKKIEWSKEEDEKLLHLAKLMPTQWRTIAPIVGRTATQCLERYQQLLDDAEALDNDGLNMVGPGAEAAPSADDVRRLRPGEIDPDPETKPAQPDPVDMDEEEKEMLSEARARLANTEGKKAKRKARERALEEARRLAMLQKRRELRVAGIFSRGKDKKQGMDYNVEIPFEKKPALGFYNTAEEAARTYEAPLGRTIRAMETGGRPDPETDKRKRDERRAANESKPQRHEDALRKMREADQVSKRRKMMLPEAQVSEQELEQIVKLGHAGQEARALVEADEGAATEGLLNEYPTLDRPREMRPPTANTDAILREATALRKRTETQTPLLGDQVGPSVVESHVLHTPRTDAMPTPTPLRDSLGINTEVPATPRSEKELLRAAKSELLSGLQSLPVPKNDFEVVVDGAPHVETLPSPSPSPLVEDAAVRDERLAQAAQEEAERAFKRRTQVVQQGLPRPVQVDPHLADAFAAFCSHDPAQKLVDEEIVALIQDDARTFPLPGARHGVAKSALPVLPDSLLDEARTQTHAELAASLGFPGARPNALRPLLSAQLETEDAALAKALKDARAATAWSVEHQAWVPKDTMDERAIVHGKAALLAHERAVMESEASAAAKGEKTLEKLLGGYQARSKTLAGKITQAAAELAEARIRHTAFARLALGEEAAATDRLDRIKEAVTQLQIGEGVAQREFKALDEERRAAQEAYETLQTEVEMRRAEQALMA